MGQYQYYEFHAIDRPLNERERRELRACSTRATITSTRFINHYEWGDFEGRPAGPDGEVFRRIRHEPPLSRSDRFARDPSLRGCQPPDTKSDRAERPTTTCLGSTV